MLNVIKGSNQLVETFKTIVHKSNTNANLLKIQVEVQMQKQTYKTFFHFLHLHLHMCYLCKPNFTFYF